VLDVKVQFSNNDDDDDDVFLSDGNRVVKVNEMRVGVEKRKLNKTFFLSLMQTRMKFS
jgi:hypothetical protein